MPPRQPDPAVPGERAPGPPAGAPEEYPSTAPEGRSWWSRGLPFACTQCGKCCHARGEYGYVYVNREERRRLSRHLGVPVAEFIRLYTELDPAGYRTLRFPGGRCVFLDGKLCRVHEAKPTQCRTWPFWKELLDSPASYRQEVQSFCPGSREGPLVPAASIRRQVAETERALALLDRERPAS